MPDVYLNGEYLPLEQARIPVMDRGFLFGDGVYEVIPAYGGFLFRLEEHLQRLENSLAAIGMQSPHSRQAWKDILQTLLDQDPGQDLSIYLQITRGAGKFRDHAIPADIQPTVFIMCTRIPPVSEELARKGVAAVTRDDIRWELCDIKAITLLAAVLFKQQAGEEQAVEAILVRDGLAMEGSASNLFIVDQGVIITPAKSQYLLPGITRDLVLEIARDAGLAHREADIPLQALRQADEVWLTSSTKEIMPVTLLDGKTVGDGTPGPLWWRMRELYQQRKQRLRQGL